jgi:FMN phosphatase YigB (HAD superfamily)
VFIDDRAENIVGAASVGIRGIVFKNPEQLSAELEPLLSGKSLR